MLCPSHFVDKIIKWNLNKDGAFRDIRGPIKAGNKDTDDEKYLIYLHYKGRGRNCTNGRY